MRAASRTARRGIVLSLGILTAMAACRATPNGSVRAEARRGSLQQITVHGKALEGNALGLPADRAVAVYLPPSYGQGSRRYPVVYLLHGIFDSPVVWTRPWAPPHPPHPGFATIQDLMDRGIARGALEEMIVVMPEADRTCHYTDSPVKGGWGTFIARDLVEHIDGSFRTIARPESRAIAGHSMGGHGAIKLAMRFPGVFSVVYAMNPSVLGWGGDVSPDNPQIVAVAGVAGLDELARQNFYVQAVVGIGQCFAPDTAAPLRTHAPFVSAAGGVQPGPARDLWTAQMPVHMAPRYAEALRSLRGLRFDSAFEDEFSHIPITARAFSTVLDSLGIEHTFEMYNGDHRNRLWGERGRLYTTVLPFVSGLLRADAEVVASASPVTRPLQAVQEELWAAARDGDSRRAARALNDGADVNAIDTVGSESGGSATGRRALNYAALHNKAAMVRWLVEHGAQVDLANRTGFTALHHAAEKGSYHAAEALLAAGADPNSKLPSGSTPLRVAQQRGHTVVVRLLEPVTRRDRVR